MGRKENVSRNIIWGVVEKVITLGIPFIMRTIMIYTMGEIYLGLNGLFTSILQVLNVAELGISTAIVYSMYRPIAEKNDDEICALLNFYKKCYRTIGIIVLVLGLLIVPFIDNLIKGAVPNDINIYVIYVINLLSTVLSYELFSYRSSIFIANQRNDFISRVRMLVVVVQAIIQIIILIYTKNYYLYIITNVLGIVVTNITVAILSRKIYPNYGCKGKIPDSTLKDIKIKVSGMLFQKIGGIVLSSVDTIVISSFLGLTILTKYQNYYYIITALFGILGIIMSSMIASIGNSVVRNSVEKNYSDFKKFNFIYVWIVSVITIILLFTYQEFIEIWVGSEMLFSNDMLILFAVYFFIHKWCDMLYVYQDACGIWWETRLIPLLAAVINLIINIILVKKIGLPGILISTIVSVVFIYDIGYALVLFKVYFKNKKVLNFFGMQVFYFIITAIAIIFTNNIIEFININNIYIRLIMNGLISLIIPNIIFIIVYWRLEVFKDVKILFKSIVKK